MALWCMKLRESYAVKKGCMYIEFLAIYDYPSKV